MTMIQVNVPDELAQRLMRYQARWIEVLEAGLRVIEPPQTEAEALQAVLQKLAQAGVLRLPLVETKPHHAPPPVPITGQPASEILIEQRGA
jgi:hypothetical protein